MPAKSALWYNNQYKNKLIILIKNTFHFCYYQVAVRVRPVAATSKEEKCIQILSKKSLFFDDGIIKNKPKKYMYDYIFGENATQDEVYHTTTSPLIKDVLKGLSAAVFAYGSTGSGKTHTMLGPNPKKAATPSNADQPPKTAASSSGDGLMVKAIDEIFRHVDESENPDAYKASYNVDAMYYDNDAMMTVVVTQ